MNAIQTVGLLVLTLAGSVAVWWVAYRFWWGGRGSGHVSPPTPVAAVEATEEPGHGGRARVLTVVAVAILALVFRRWRRNRAKRRRAEALRAECARLPEG